MPVADFTPESKITRGENYPRLRLEKDEKARIVIIGDVTFRWQHRLEKIAVKGGVPVVIQKERQNGDTYEDYDTEFVGTMACLGDNEILQERGLDPNGCPICQASRDYPEAIRGPQRRFAAQVFKYRTKPGSFDVAQPYSGEILVWPFTERRYGELVDVREEFGDIRQHDLMLGPCKNAVFQNFEIKASCKAEWLADDDRKTFTASPLKEGKLDVAELEDICARVVEQRFLQEDIETVVQRWQHVQAYEANQMNGGSTGSQVLDEAGAEEATADIGDLLDGVFEQGKSEEPEPTPAATEDEPAAEEEGPAGEEPAAEEGEAITGLDDLDDLLGG